MYYWNGHVPGSFSVGSGARFGALNSLLAVEVLEDANHMAIFPL